MVILKMFLLDKNLWFPNPFFTDDEGLLAIGGDLSIDRLLLAYSNGIFPWFMDDGDIYWFCPPERMVIIKDEFHASRSLKKVMRSGKFRLTEDQAFGRVIRFCAEVHTKKYSSTWINDEFIDAYVALHYAGHAHSVEVWQDKELVGGIYGVAVGRLFCGESMFHSVNNASKIALLHLVESESYSMIDCQVPTPHLLGMGAKVIPRDEFLHVIKEFHANK